MRVAEARWIGKTIGNLRDLQVQPCLNLGSSTGDFREKRQPHIDNLIFEPLRRRNIKIYHADLKKADGVDLTGDILDPGFQRALAQLRPGITILSNVLEHVTDRAGVIAACSAIVPPGHFLLVTVPYSYPYHADPIDTGFRPDPEQMVAEFPDFSCLDSQIIVDTSFGREIANNNSGIKILAFALRLGIRLLLPFYHPAAWFSSVHRLTWLWRPFKVSAMLLRKKDVKNRNAR